MMSAIVWFRRDLRLADNPAWTAAAREHGEVTALFIVDPFLWDSVTQGRRDLLGSHLGALDQALRERGGRLRVEVGEPVTVLGAIGSDAAVYWNRDHSPYAQERDTAVSGVVGRVSQHEGSYIHGPGTVVKSDGSPYRVFSAYWKAWANMPVVDLPGDAPAVSIATDPGQGIPPFTPVAGAGESAASERLADFLERVDTYDRLRDTPALEMTSRMSSDLKFGTIAPHRLFVEVADATPGRLAFIRQLAWRDFYAQVMAERPDTVRTAYRSEFSSIPWDDDPDGFAAWTVGRTGFPFVDAGMRQLANEGFMHGRVRMVTASFLTKDLLIDWRRGERWFRRHLIDGDVAQNVGNWQWVAGTGVDAAPYFRVFNPTIQARRFDPDGEYIRRWVPELRDLSTKHIHDPWGHAAHDVELLEMLTRSGYPQPIVNHAEARIRTIEVLAAARRAS